MVYGRKWERTYSVINWGSQHFSQVLFCKDLNMKEGIIKYSRNGKVLSGRLHDELVMMDLDSGKYYSLNAVATRIWDLLEKPLDLDSLCGILAGEYEVDAANCHSEVEECLKEMVRLELVTRCQV